MRRRSFLAGGATLAGLIGAGLHLGACGDASAPAWDVDAGSIADRRPNVLFLAVDDMNDWAGFLNPHPGTHTPNMDALAARSLVFDHAYCTVPICLPSRTGVLWGRHAATSGVYDHSQPSRERYVELSEVVPSLVESFAAAGYRTVGAGKISHGAMPDWWDAWHETVYYVDAQARDDEGREGQYDPDWRSPYDGAPIGRGEHFTSAMLDWGPSGVSSVEQPDGASSQWVREQLRHERHEPFFLAYGVTQPHTPWRIPQRFFDLHPLDGVVVPESRADDLDDLSSYVHDEILIRSPLATLQRHDLWREAVRAYQAAISFADWCVGQVLDELAASPHAENTVVVLWSDHGYHLGEKLHWHKLALWERATRVPFLLHVPGQPLTGRFDAPVSLLDVGPTLAELCGVALDPGHEGVSLLRVLEDPARAEDRPPITTWRPGNHSVRQGPYRYIRYETGDRELYDHRDDPGELRNLSGAASARSVMEDLDAFLPPAG